MRVTSIFVSSLAAGLTAAAPAEVRDVKSDFYHPIGKLPAGSFKVESLASSAPPTRLTLNVDDLFAQYGNATSEAAPSHGVSITDAELAALEKRQIGTDERVLTNNVNYPWTAIGRLGTSDGYVCSGTLIGSRIVATAKHCVSNHPSGTTYSFAPDFFDTARFGQAGVTLVVTLGGYTDNGDACYQKWDWALLVLDQPLGTSQGYFGAKVWDDSLSGQAILYNAGYPVDLANGARMYSSSGRAGKHWVSPSGATCDNGGGISTNCDVTPGMSGGPLWQLDSDNNLWQFGVLSASSSYEATFAAGQEWVNAIIDLRNTYPN